MTSDAENNVLCKKTDVSKAIKDSIEKFVLGKHYQIKDLIKIINEEFSKIQTFAPLCSGRSIDEIKQKVNDGSFKSEITCDCTMGCVKCGRGTWDRKS